MKNIIIIYHNDLDGFGAAWAAWKKFGNKADYLPVDFDKPAPQGLKDKYIYMLDFSYPEKEMKALLENNKGLMLIDHHASRKSLFKIVPNYIWDIKHSGCVLAWKYFNKGGKVPKLLEFIEDMDLWKFKIKNTKEITLFMENFPRDFVSWDKLSLEIENKKKFSEYLERGKAIAGFVDKIVEYIGSRADEAVFEGKRVMVANSPVFGSEIGNYLIKKTKKPVAIIWSLKNGNIRVQLRSVKEIDVSKIAQKYGGGGHKQAAGFALSAGENIPWRKIEK